MTSETEKAAADLADALLVQTYLRSRARKAAQVGPFSTLFSASQASPYANYAIPADGAAPTAAEIAALEAAFVARRRKPRLEYVPMAAPAVEAALLEAGFSIELRPPLMTRRPDGVVATATEGFDFVFLDDPERLNQAAAVQAEAFGGEADVRWLADAAAKGGRILAAYCRETGKAASTGAFIPPIDGVTEVVGIATGLGFRRRGLAQAVTGMLAEAAFDAGCTLAFLSAAGEAQSEIYARAGFVRRSPMLFISKTID